MWWTEGWMSIDRKKNIQTIIEMSCRPQGKAGSFLTLRLTLDFSQSAFTSTFAVWRVGDDSLYKAAGGTFFFSHINYRSRGPSEGGSLWWCFRAVFDYLLVLCTNSGNDAVSCLSTHMLYCFSLLLPSYHLFLVLFCFVSPTEWKAGVAALFNSHGF